MRSRIQTVELAYNREMCHDCSAVGIYEYDFFTTCAYVIYHGWQPHSWLVVAIPADRRNPPVLKIVSTKAKAMSLAKKYAHDKQRQAARRHKSFQRALKTIPRSSSSRTHQEPE